MKGLCFIVSIILHLCIFGFVGLSIKPHIHKIIEHIDVDIVELPKPPIPEPDPVKPSQSAPPAPVDDLSRQTAQLVDASTPPPPPPQEPPPQAEPAPQVAQGTTPISAVKKGTISEPDYSGVEERDGKLLLHNKHGLEKFNMRQLIVRDFSEDEYLGHYVTADGRIISILDGRERFGNLVIYDSKTHLFRKLTKYRKMIYSYGPSFSNPDPQIGTIIFLTSKDHNLTVRSPSRIMMMFDEPKTLFATNEYIVEEQMDIPWNNQVVQATLYYPFEPGRYPAVLFYPGNNCGREDLIMEMAKFLAIHRITVLTVPGPLCQKSPDVWNNSLPLEQETLLVKDALNRLLGHEKISINGLAIWGADQGTAASFQASRDNIDIDYRILTFHEPHGSKEALLAQTLLKAIEQENTLPTLCVVTGTQAAKQLRSFRKKVVADDNSQLSLQAVQTSSDPNRQWINWINPEREERIAGWLLSL